MSFSISLPPPLSNFYDAYVDANYEFSLPVYSNLDETKIYIGRHEFTFKYKKDEAEYSSKSNKISNLKNEIQPLLDRIGIRKNLLIFEHYHPNDIFGSEGTNDYGENANIYVPPGFYNMDKESFIFVLKHEIAHIKNNDYVMISLVTGICSIVFTIFSIYALALPFWAGIIIAPISSVLFKNIVSQFQERAADDFAITESDEEGLKGGRRFLKSWQMLADEEGVENDDFLSRVWILSHPSGHSRIEKIEEEMSQRNIVINEAEESEKIALMLEFFKDWNRHRSKVKHDLQRSRS